MTRGRVVFFFFAFVAACSSSEEERETITVTRTGTTLEVIGRSSSEITLRMNLMFDGPTMIGMVEDSRGVPGVIGIEGDAMPLGTIDGGEERLTLRAENASLGSSTFAYGAELESAVEGSTGVGLLLRRLLPLQLKVRSVMAETRGLFRIAALADPDADSSPRTWPAQTDPLDSAPVGRLDGDIADVGMTCGAGIFCPGHAPICSDQYGFCTRTCLDDDDCPPRSACLGAVSGSKFCFFECGPGVPCAGLLECTGRTAMSEDATICARKP